MHGIEVRKHQDTLALAPRRLAFQDVAEPVAARDALELQSKIAELALDLVDHDIDRLGIVTGAFDRHPLDDAFENLLGIDLRFVFQFSHQTGSQVKYSGERFMSVKYGFIDGTACSAIASSVQ